MMTQVKSRLIHMLVALCCWIATTTVAAQQETAAATALPTVHIVSATGPVPIPTLPTFSTSAASSPSSSNSSSPSQTTLSTAAIATISTVGAILFAIAFGFVLYLIIQRRARNAEQEMGTATVIPEQASMSMSRSPPTPYPLLGKLTLDIEKRGHNIPVSPRSAGPLVFTAPRPVSAASSITLASFPTTPVSPTFPTSFTSANPFGQRTTSRQGAAPERPKTGTSSNKLQTQVSTTAGERDLPLLPPPSPPPAGMRNEFTLCRQHTMARQTATLNKEGSGASKKSVANNNNSNTATATATTTSENSAPTHDSSAQRRPAGVERRPSANNFTE
jgi:hypothetical protein